MHPALWVSKTGLDAQQTRTTVISNNLANVQTTGFKKDRAIFSDLLYQNIRQPGGSTSQTTVLPSGLMLGTGVKTVATQKIHQEGNFEQTGNPLDVAIQGQGFLQVLKPDGTIAYSRDGRMQVDATGKLQTSDGYEIQPSITIPTNALSITIGSDGTLSAQVAGSATPTQAGTVQLATFMNPAGLQPVGQNLFTETAASGTPTTGNPGTNGIGTLLQGSLESSNVNVVEELVGLIEAQRAYEMNSKAVTTVSEMLQAAAQNL